MSHIGQLGAPHLDAIVLELHAGLASADVRLASGDGRGFIALRHGDVVDASIDRGGRIPGVVGAPAVYEMLRWSSGTYAILAANRPSAITVFAAPNDLVLEGLRRLCDPGEIRRRLPPAGTIFEVARATRGVLETPLSHVELTLLSEIDGRRTLGETLERSVVGVALARQTVLRLIAIGLLRVRVADGVRRSLAGEVRAMFSLRRALRSRRARRFGTQTP